MAVSDRLGIGAVLAVGIVAPGLATYVLSANGYAGLGQFVWAGGYGAMVLLVWYVWIRPLDLTGPSG